MHSRHTSIIRPPCVLWLPLRNLPNLTTGWVCAWIQVRHQRHPIASPKIRAVLMHGNQSGPELEGPCNVLCGTRPGPVILLHCIQSKAITFCQQSMFRLPVIAPGVSVWELRVGALCCANPQYFTGCEWDIKRHRIGTAQCAECIVCSASRPAPPVSALPCPNSTPPNVHTH